MIQIIPSGNTNCYLLTPEGGGKRILVDAGTAADARFLDRLAALGPLEDLGLVLLTHGHHDHVGHAARLQGEFGVPVALHPADWETVIRGEQPFPPARHGLGRAVRWLTLQGLDRAKYPPFTPDLPLAPGPLPRFPGVEILALPGHTAGSVGVAFQGCLLAGDLVMHLFRPTLTWFAQDVPAAQASLRRVAGGAFRTLYPGHGRPISGAWLRRWGGQG